MKVKDKTLNVKVDVFCAQCPSYECYWPRHDPGVIAALRATQRKLSDIDLNKIGELFNISGDDVKRIIQLAETMVSTT